MLEPVLGVVPRRQALAAAGLTSSSGNEADRAAGARLVFLSTTHKEVCTNAVCWRAGRFLPGLSEGNFKEISRKFQENLRTRSFFLGLSLCVVFDAPLLRNAVVLLGH